MSRVGKDNKRKLLGEVSEAWTYTVRELQVVKNKLATYWMQKAAGSGIADSVFTACSAGLFDAYMCKDYAWQTRQCI